MRLGSPLGAAVWPAVVLSVLVGSVAGAQSGPDAYGYQASSVSSSFEDISATGTPVAGYYPLQAGIPIGFDYVFYGRQYHTVAVNGYGFLQFGGGADWQSWPAPLTQAAPPFLLDLPAVCVLWNWWWPSGTGGVYYQTLGSAPNRRFIVQWDKMVSYTTYVSVTFQAVLFEGTDQILLRYGDAYPDYGYPFAGSGCIVGIHDTGGGKNGRTVPWSDGSAIINSGDAILFSGDPAAARVTGLSPAQAPEYNGDTFVQVFGRNFSDGDTVVLNGTDDMVTTYMSPNELDAVIPDSYFWDGPMPYTIGVRSAAAGASSNTVAFDVGPTAPAGLAWAGGVGSSTAAFTWGYELDANATFGVQIKGPGDTDFHDLYGYFNVSAPGTYYGAAYRGDLYGLEPETTYSLRLRPQVNGVLGAPSDGVDFIPGLYNVQNFKGTSAGPTEWDLSWTNRSTLAQSMILARTHAVYDANGQVQWYMYIGAWDFFLDNVAPTTTTYADMDVQSGGRYQYWLQANANHIVASTGRMVSITSNATIIEVGHLAPQANDDTYQTDAGQALNVASPGILGNDYKSDGKLTLTAAKVTDPGHGSVTVNADGSFQYQPNAGFSGKDSFTYKANDGTADSSPATVTVNVVGGPNNPPTADGQSVTVLQDTAKDITLTGSDPDSDSITFAITSNPSHGTLSGSAPNVTYKPSSGYFGNDSFQFKTTDSHGADSAPATVSITVVGKPTANPQSVSTEVGTQVAVILTGADPNTPPLPLTYTVTANPANGTLTGSAPNVTYKPNAGYYGSDSFQFKVSNGLIDSDAATVGIQVNTPVPVLTGIDPASALVGAGDVAVTLQGSGFVSGSQVTWNSATNLATAYVSPTVLRAVIPSSLTSTAGTGNIGVVNPSPGGGTSGSLAFTVNNPSPTLTLLTPNSAPAGTNGVALVVNGTNFVAGSVVRWNGADLPTTYGSGTQLTATVPAVDLRTQGTAAVTVFSPGPGGGLSGQLTFTVGPPAIASLAGVELRPGLASIKSGLAAAFRLWAQYQMTDGTLSDWTDVTEHGATFSSNGKGKMTGIWLNVYQSLMRTPETVTVTGVYAYKSSQMSCVATVAVYR